MKTWSLSWHGLRTVIELELKQRVRSRRWIIALIGWFLIIGSITALVMWAINEQYGRYEIDYQSSIDPAGPIAFGVITFFVLGMSLVIAPAFTATSINGDRAAGTLATLQATRLSALEIAAGKLVAAWCAAAVFLVVALPFLAWAVVLGEISWRHVLVCFLLVFIEVAVVSAIGLGWSALIGRAAGSTVMSYLTVVVLTALTPMVFGLLTMVTIQEQQVRVWGLSMADQAAWQREIDQYWNDNPDGDGSDAPAPPIGKCTWTTRSESVTRTDLVWWTLLPNPFVVVADAAPLPGEGEKLTDVAYRSPLTMVSYGVRMARLEPASEVDECVQLYWYGPYQVEELPDGTSKVTTQSGTPVNVDSPVKPRTISVEDPIWPWGLASNVILGALFFWVAVRRLAVPYGSLPRGTRVA